MCKVIISVGVPLSGKSAYASNLIASDSSWVEINRDEIRKKLFNVSGWSDYEISVEKESAVTTAQYDAIRAAMDAGKNIIITNTNLRMKYIRRFVSLFEHHGCEISIKLFSVNLMELVRRNYVADTHNSNSEKDIVNLLKHYEWLKQKVITKFESYAEEIYV